MSFKEDLNKFEKEYELKIKQALSRTFILELGKIARDIIYKRTKSGKQANGSGFKPLSSSYVKQRQGKLAIYTDNQGRIRAFKPNKTNTKKLGRFGSPRKSNLTNTGEMLEDFVIDLLSNGTGVQIRIGDTRRQDGKTNSEIASYVSEDRPFLELTESELQILVRKVEQRLRQAARKI